jgi:hypothetical protein
MPSSRGQLRTAADAALVVLFLCAVGLPLATKLCGWQGATVLQEKRRLAERPPLRLEPAALAAFPSRFDAYYADRFGLRPELVRWHGIAQLEWLGVSPRPDVLAGKDGWLYLNMEQTIEDHRGLCPFSVAELEGWRRTLDERQDWLAERGIGFLFFVVPNKQTIYPEYLPAGLKRVRPQSRGDQLVDYLVAHSRVAVLDLRRPLREAKGQERLYQRTDTHWNERGAWVAYREVLTVLQRWVPAVRALPRAAFTAAEAYRTPGDLAQMVGLADRLHEPWLVLWPRSPRRARLTRAGIPPRPDLPPDQRPFATECPDASLPRAVMFRDSFAISLVPRLSEHFSRIVYLWQYNFDPATIERERPDVVIEELSERKLIYPQLATNPPYLGTSPGRDRSGP